MTSVWGCKTTRVENRGETTRGETSWGLLTAKITENISNRNITVGSSGHLSCEKTERFNHYLHYRGANQFKRVFLIARVMSLTPEVWILFP